MSDSGLLFGAMQRGVVLSSVCAVAVVEGVPLAVSSQKTSDGSSGATAGLRHKQVLEQKTALQGTQAGTCAQMALRVNENRRVDRLSSV